VDDVSTAEPLPFGCIAETLLRETKLRILRSLLRNVVYKDSGKPSTPPPR
jgi:hypothetical protein